MRVLTTVEIDEVAGDGILGPYFGPLFSALQVIGSALYNQQEMYGEMGPEMAAAGLFAVAGGNLGA